MSINDSYFYDDVPIYNYNIYFNIPDDGKEYAFFTKCEHSMYDDPMIFIYGPDPYRVIGYNDDAPSEAINELELSGGDAYLSQKYSLPPTMVNVSNYQSLNPISKCELRSGIIKGSQSIVKSRQTQSAAIETIQSAPVTSTDVNIDSNQLIVKSSNTITSITVCDIYGRQIATRYVAENVFRESIGSLGLQRNCLYIVALTLDNGNTTAQKIYINK